MRWSLGACRFLGVGGRGFGLGCDGLGVALWCCRGVCGGGFAVEGGYAFLLGGGAQRASLLSSLSSSGPRAASVADSSRANVESVAR